MNPFDPFEKKGVKKRANALEKKVARKHDYRRQPCSGAIAGFKGDLKSDSFLFDLKSTDASSIRIDLAMLRKIRDEATVIDKSPCILLHFNDVERLEEEYAVIPMSVFRELTEKKE